MVGGLLNSASSLGLCPLISLLATLKCTFYPKCSTRDESLYLPRDFKHILFEEWDWFDDLIKYYSHAIFYNMHSYWCLFHLIACYLSKESTIPGYQLFLVTAIDSFIQVIKRNQQYQVLITVLDGFNYSKDFI